MDTTVLQLLHQNHLIFMDLMLLPVSIHRINYMWLTTVYLSGIISGHSNDELVYTDIDNAKISLGCVGYYDTNNVK